jgi:hypothetical protein
MMVNDINGSASPSSPYQLKIHDHDSLNVSDIAI